MSESYALEMGTLLTAMKEKAIADNDDLAFLTDVRIMPAAMYPGPWSSHTLYLIPMGSPETEITEQGDVYAEHMIVMDAVMPTVEPNEENTIGDGENIGITTFVSRVLKFFSGNLLGLAGLGIEFGVPPVCMAAQNAYEPIAGGDENETLLLTGRMLYRARTRPFPRVA
jgi:hypothetical protein